MLYKDCNQLKPLRFQHLQEHDIFEPLQNDEERNSDGESSSHPQRALSKENIRAVVFGKSGGFKIRILKNLQHD